MSERKEPAIFLEAVDAATRWLRANVPLADDGRPVRLEPEVFPLRLELGIHFLQPVPERPFPLATCSEEAGLALWTRCQVEPAAWDLCRHVAALSVRHGVPMPDGVRRFTDDFLRGAIREPKRAKRSERFGENLACVVLIALVHRRFGLNPTRNETTKERFSACDAVAEATFHWAPGPPTRRDFAAMRNLWRGTAYAQLRREAAGWLLAIDEFKAKFPETADAVALDSFLSI